MMADPDGNLPFFILTLIIGVVIGAGAGVGIGYATGVRGNDLIWWGVGGAIIGSAIGAGIGMAISHYATGSAFSSTRFVYDKLIGRGFKTFDELKAYMTKHYGALDDGFEWHHLVEQNQIRHSGFAATKVQNTKNNVAVNNTTHTKISSFYSSRFKEFSRFRIALRGESFRYQFKIGIQYFKYFGGIL